MKQQSAIILLVSVLAGCGGGSGGSNHDNESPRHNDDNPVTAPTTPVGTPLGAAISTIIGSDGGQLQSADGSLTLVVPAGAFNGDTSVSIQPISNQAIGGIGGAFRIKPEGLKANLPITLRFHPDEESLQGSALRFVTIGYQDSKGHWRVFEEPVHNESNNTVAIETLHFSDWSMVAGVQLRPGSATVKTNASQVLEIRVCGTNSDNSADPYDPDKVLPPVMLACESAPVTAFSAKHWSVNGMEGGNTAIGAIVPDTQRFAGKATYTAPDSVPDVNPVAVSVQVHDFDNPTVQTTLVSQINVIDDVTCETMQDLEEINAEIAFDRFQWSARNDSEAYQGNQLGRLGATMKNLIPKLGRPHSPIGIWSSVGNPHYGLVSINDTHWHYYPDETVTVQAIGNGLPYIGIDAPSFISITVDYATCTYELVSSFVINGSVIENGVGAEAPLGVGGIYYRESLPDVFLANGSVERQAVLSANYDTNDKINGYYPGGQNAELRAQGSTIAKWTLSFQ